MSGDTMIVHVDQFHPGIWEIEAGAAVIRRGGTVIFPTETVYGLGANALSEEACMKIFTAKNRPVDNPLIVHVSSMEMLGTIAELPEDNLADKLKTLWPGPLTVLLHKKPVLPDTVTAGLPTVAVRMPDNLLALALIESSGVPIAAPSANLSTRPSITDSSDAIREMEGRVDLIYDAGPTKLGIESTIIDVSVFPPVLLRAGSTPVEILTEIFGDIEITDIARGVTEVERALTPGMRYRHYSPEKRLYLIPDVNSFIELGKRNLGGNPPLFIGASEYCRQISNRFIDLGSADNLDTVASRLFSAFRKLDADSCPFGVIHPFAEKGQGLAIMNRIRKASGHRELTLDEALYVIHGGTE